MKKVSSKPPAGRKENEGSVFMLCFDVFCFGGEGLGAHLAMFRAYTWLALCSEITPSGVQGALCIAGNQTGVGLFDTRQTRQVS